MVHNLIGLASFYRVELLSSEYGEFLVLIMIGFHLPGFRLLNPTWEDESFRDADWGYKELFEVIQNLKDVLNWTEWSIIKY